MTKRWNNAILALSARSNRGESGMTIAEILIALAIVALVLGAAALAGFGALERQKEKTTIAVMKEVKNAVDQWKMATNGTCPEDLDDLAKGEEKSSSQFLTKAPRDGWNRKFVVKCPPENDDPIDLTSMGKDGKLGTSDDIFSWKVNK